MTHSAEFSAIDLMDLMNIKIKIMTQEHVSAVADIERECFSEPWSEESLGLFLTDSGFCMVALDGERVLGYVSAMCVLDEAQIVNVAVIQSARRQGIAKELLHAFESEAAARKIVSLSLEVRESNGAARKLYREDGWLDAGVRKNFYSSPREDGIVMIKSLLEG